MRTKNQIGKHVLDVGVLFIIFNRPETTEKVFKKIRAAKPLRLYIGADGPREHHPTDKGKCRAARKIVESVDWDCKVKRLYREKNLGCGLAVSNALNWFFEHENEGIILEDDCLPDTSFFKFCHLLLDKYRDDPRVMHINGNTFRYEQNRSSTKKNGNASYNFTSFPQVWGWATWLRAWEKYDFRMESWPAEKRKLSLRKQFPSLGIYFQKSLHFDRVYEGLIDTWDYQWQYAVIKNGGLAVVPEVNLVSNIGYGDDSTHLKKFDGTRHDLENDPIDFPLRHPPNVGTNNSINKHYARHMDMNFNSRNFLKYLYRYIKPLKCRHS